ncbi:GDSL family lipase [Leucothrix sargassi]|nr:GDSL family lipase [Leucothrix sargassi]
MFKLIFIFWLLLVHAIAMLALVETDLAYRIDRKLGVGLLTSKELTHFYEEMVGSHQQIDGSVLIGSTVFLGDSITQALNVNAITQPSVNFGIGMDTTFGLLERLPKYTSLQRASRIVIAIGVNDLIRTHRDNTEIIENYLRFFALLPSGVPVTIHAILPVDEQLTQVDFNTRIQQLNSDLSQLAKIKQADFFDMTALLSDSNGQLKSEYHIGDGLHLSTQGYAIWIDALKQHLLKIDSTK